MQNNAGNVDRVFRIVVGLALIVAGYMTVNYWLFIGVIPFVTGIVGYCPAYTIFGISTCSVKQDS